MFDWLPAHQTLNFDADGNYRLDFPDVCPLLVYPREFDDKHCLPASYHEHFEIVYFYEGAGRFTVANQDFIVEQGDLFLVRNAEYHVLNTCSRNPLKVICMYFMPHLIYTPGSIALDFEYLKPFYRPVEAKYRKVSAKSLQNQDVVSVIQNITWEIQTRSEHYPLAAKAHFLQILLAVARQFVQAASEQIVHDQQSIARLKNVLTYLRQHYHEKITLAEVADIAYMSPCYFSKFFKLATGSTFTEYLLKLRVDHAKELLINSDQSITEIAFHVGFSSHSYFDRVFQRMTEVSPRSYRKIDTNNLRASPR